MESLADGNYTVRVTAQDVAGNETVTDYDFIKDTASPALPVATLTIEGVNSGAAFAGDGVINREELGYGTAGNNLEIGVALEDTQGTKIVSVKVNDFEVEGVPYHVLSEDAHGATLAAGNYLIAKVSDTEYNAYLVTGDGSGASPYHVSDTGIALTGMDLTAYNNLATPARAEYVPISVLGEAGNASLTGLYHVNLLDVISPDEYHSSTQTLSVVVEDLAGNFTTQTLDFDVDTLLPGAPDIVVERTISSTVALDLNYWETVDTFNGVQGVRFQVTEAAATEQVLPDTVTVNGTAATAIDVGSGVYFVARTDLVDSVGGLQRIGEVNFEVDGITAARPVFSLTTTDHGVSAGGNYILIGNSTDGWQAHGVSGDGSVTPFTVDATADTGTLAATLFDGTNVIEFEVEDANGNTNTYTEHFTSDLDEPSGQFYAVTSSLHTTNAGANDVLRIDVFVSDHALADVVGVSNYEGSSFDLLIDLPDAIFDYPSSAYSFSSHADFFDAEARYDADANTITWGAFQMSHSRITTARYLQWML